MTLKNLYIQPLLALLLLLNTQNCIAQWKAEPAYLNFTVESGLPSNQVYQVLEDQAGYFWMVTDRGVARYDGYQFETFGLNEGLNDLVVFSILQTESGEIWCVTQKNNLFQYKNGRFHPHPQNNKLTALFQASPQAPRTCFFVSPDEEDAFLLSIDHAGYWKILTDTVYIFQPEPLKKTRKQHSAYKYFFKTFEGNQALGFRMSTSLPCPSGTNVYFLDQEDHISSSSHPEHFNGNTLFISNHASSTFVMHDRDVFSISDRHLVHRHKADSRALCAIDVDNMLLVGTINHGIEVHDPKWTTPIHWLSHTSVSNIMTDQNGFLWVSTLDHGVFLIQDLHVLHYTHQTSVQAVKKCFKIQEKLYAGGSRGDLIRLDPTEGKPTRVTSLPESYPRHVEQFNASEIILCNPRGVWRFNEHLSPYTVPTNMDGSTFWKKQRWCFKGMWLNHLTDSAVHAPIEASFHSPSRIEKLAPLEDVLLVGTRKGLYKFKKGKFELFDEAFRNMRISDIYLHDHKIFVSTLGSGLAVLEHNQITWINKTKGLKHDLCNHLDFFQNRIYVGTNGGVSLIDPVTLVVIPNNQHYDIRDQVYTTAHLDQDLLLGVPHGLIRIREKQLSKRKPRHHLHLNKFTLDAENHSLAVSFKAIVPEARSQATYTYQLQGLSEQWLSTKDTSLFFSTLPPGKYTLTIDLADQQSVTPISFTLSVPKFWYQWLSTQISFSLLVLTLIWSITQWRIKRIRKRMSIENRMITAENKALRAQVNPHFFFNVMQSIQTVVLQGDNKKATSLLSNFSTLMRRVLDSSRNEWITLEDELNLLSAYLNLEQTRLNNKFDFEIIHSEGLDIELEVPPTLIQPFIENAIVHGITPILLDRQGVIQLNFIQHDNFMEVLIKDNGKGLQTAKDKNHKSVGTTVIHERLERLLPQSLEPFIEYRTAQEGFSTVVRVKIPYRDWE